jgi:hypothetical protein
MAQAKVVWYEDNYLAVRDGTDGHHAHKEVETHLHIVKQAIEDPNQVNKKVNKRGKGKGNCYYAWFSGGNAYPNHHMKAVVRKTIFGKLKVVTAYFTLSFSQGETMIWKKT